MNPMQNKTPEQRKLIAAKAHATRRARREKMQLAKQDAITYAGGLRHEIDALEAKLGTLQRMETMNLASAAMTGKILLREDEIVKAALPWEHSSGVYFLLDGNEIVYVGQAKNVYVRISCHTDKRFDRYAFVPCSLNALDKVESLYIHYLRPRLNGNQTNGVKCAPITLDKLLGLIPDASSPLSRQC